MLDGILVFVLICYRALREDSCEKGTWLTIGLATSCVYISLGGSSKSDLNKGTVTRL